MKKSVLAAPRDRTVDDGDDFFTIGKKVMHQFKCAEIIGNLGNPGNIRQIRRRFGIGNIVDPQKDHRNIREKFIMIIRPKTHGVVVANNQKVIGGAVF